MLIPTNYVRELEHNLNTHQSNQTKTTLQRYHYAPMRNAVYDSWRWWIEWYKGAFSSIQSLRVQKVATGQTAGSGPVPHFQVGLESVQTLLFLDTEPAQIKYWWAWETECKCTREDMCIYCLLSDSHRAMDTSYQAWLLRDST